MGFWVVLIMLFFLRRVLRRKNEVPYYNIDWIFPMSKATLREKRGLKKAKSGFSPRYARALLAEENDKHVLCNFEPFKSSFSHAKKHV